MSEIHVDTLKNKAGTGAPDFPEGATVTGVVTATGGFSGNATGLTGTPSITVQDVTAEYVSIGGTLTYDDVINVDSVGIVTAGRGVRIPDGGIDIIGITTGLSVSGVATFVGLTTYADGLIVTSGLTTAGAGLTVTGDAKFAATAGTGTTIGLGGVNVSGMVTAYHGFDGPGNVPAKTTTSTYALIASDAGKLVLIDNTCTLPAATFAAGDAISVYNNTGGNLTLTCSAPTAVYLGSDGSTKTSLTLATHCICTFVCVNAASNGTFVATGGGLS